MRCRPGGDPPDSLNAVPTPFPWPYKLPYSKDPETHVNSGIRHAAAFFGREAGVEAGGLRRFQPLAGTNGGDSKPNSKAPSEAGSRSTRGVNASRLRFRVNVKRSKKSL